MESNFTEYRLGDIASFAYGKMPKKPLLGSGKYITYSGYRYIEPYPEKNASAGDVIVVARGVGGTGDVKLVSQDCYLTNLSIRISLNQKYLLNEYFYYIFNQKNLRYLDSGSAQSQITIADLSNIVLHVPSTEHQRSVTNHLKKIDDKITLNRQINQTLEQMAQALFKSWFVDFDPVVDNALEAGFFEQELDLPDELLRRAEARQAVHKQSDFKPLPEATRQLFPAAFEACPEPSLGLGGWVPKGWQIQNIKDFANVTDYVANGSFAALKENVTLFDEPEYALYIRTTDFKNDFNKGKAK
jgi:type I restriction enzyme, S subunit